jgi:hypothetical protein
MHAAKLLLIGLCVALVGKATAAPIRVGILKGTGAGRYWHTSMHPGANVIATLLASPAGAGLNNPVIPPQGFAVRLFGPDSNQCSGSGCGPTAEQRNSFINALDSLDVIVILNFVELGNTINSQEARAKLVDFWSKKGVVSLHQSNDNFGTWSDWLNVGASRMLSHPPQMRATLRLDNVNGAGSNGDWKFLNHGLPDSARFHEEWLTFSRSSAELRAGGYSSDLVQSGNYPPVVVTTNLDETTYEQPVTSSQSMGGDHPMSWYRKFSTGGKFFYTAIGHRTETYDSVYFFRRQLYNAILWAGGYDITTSVATQPSIRFSDHARITLFGSSFSIAVVGHSSHTITLHGLNGRLIATRRGTAKRGDHSIKDVPSGVYVLKVATGTNTVSRRVVVP